MRDLQKKATYTVIGAFYFSAVWVLSMPANVYGASSNCPSGSGFCNPLRTGLDTVSGFTVAFLKAVIFVLFPIAVVFMVYSGFKFIIAQGNEQELKKAKLNFFWVVIGLSVLLGATALAAILKGTINPIIGK